MKQKMLSVVLTTLMLLLTLGACGKETTGTGGSIGGGIAVSETSSHEGETAAATGESTENTTETGKEPETTQGMINAKLSICYLNESEYKDTLAPEFSADDTDYTTKLAVTPDKALPGLTVYKIELADMTDDGKAIYKADRLYTSGGISAGSPFCFEMTFFGDMPSYAVGYTESDGTECVYAVTQSGMDGSVGLDRIEIK